MKSKLIKESLNEFIDMSDEKFLYIFIDEDHYDDWASDFEKGEDPHADKGFEGYSALPVYMSMEEIDPYDNDYIAEIDRDELTIVGKALVGFKEEGGGEEVLEIIQGNFDSDSIEFLWPTP